MAQARKHPRSAKSTQPATTITVNRTFNVVMHQKTLNKIRDSFRDNFVEFASIQTQDEIDCLDEKTCEEFADKVAELMTDSVIVEFITALMEGTQEPFTMMRDFEDGDIIIQDDEAEAAYEEFVGRLFKRPEFAEALKSATARQKEIDKTTAKSDAEYKQHEQRLMIDKLAALGFAIEPRSAAAKKLMAVKLPQPAGKKVGKSTKRCKPARGATGTGR